MKILKHGRVAWERYWRGGVPAAVSMRVPGARQYYAFRHGSRRVAAGQKAKWFLDDKGREIPVYKQRELHQLLGVPLASKWYRSTNARSRRDIMDIGRKIVGARRRSGQLKDTQARLARVILKQGSALDWIRLAANPKLTARALTASGSEVTRKGWETRRKKYGRSGRRRSSHG